MDYKKFFKNKRITIMGLGLLGGALNDTIFLAKQGAKLIVTDLKSEEELRPSLKKLSRFKNMELVLGRHRLKDFRNRDFILQPGNVPADSPFLTEARKNKVPVYVSESLFVKYTEGTLIGITGTRGKSTTTQIILEILEKLPPKGGRIFLGGNVKNVSTLSLLNKVKKEDIVVLELDSWALHGMGGIKRSPHIAVFTTFMDDHLNYYKGNRARYLSDKANIFLYQTAKDYLVLGRDVSALIQKKYKQKIKSKIVSPAKIPSNWRLRLLGKHNKENLSLAIAVADILKIPKNVTKKTVENFKGVTGRMELVRIYRGIKIYNDTTATTPQATLAALKALSKKKNIVLIMGGADKGISMKELVKKIPKYCKALIILSGTGTDRIAPVLRAKDYKLNTVSPTDSLKEAVAKALKYSKRGDIILFSPAFASFGMFENEFYRGDEFIRLVNKLK